MPDRLWNAPPPPARGGAPRNAAGLRCGGAARVPSRPVRAALSGLPVPARRPAGWRTPSLGTAGTEASEPRPGTWRHTWPRPPSGRRGVGPWRWPGCGDPQALSSRVSGSGDPPGRLSNTQLVFWWVAPGPGPQHAFSGLPPVLLEGAGAEWKSVLWSHFPC